MNLRKIKALLFGTLCGATLMLGGVNVKATESVTWSSAKTPGSSAVSTTVRTMTYYMGNIKFIANSLYTDSSYVVGKCRGLNGIVIDNNTQYAAVSIVNRATYFKIKPTTDGRTTMKFEGYIDHNATLYQAASGSGTISF